MANMISQNPSFVVTLHQIFRAMLSMTFYNDLPTHEWSSYGWHAEGINKRINKRGYGRILHLPFSFLPKDFIMYMHFISSIRQLRAGSFLACFVYHVVRSVVRGSSAWNSSNHVRRLWTIFQITLMCICMYNSEFWWNSSYHA